MKQYPHAVIGAGPAGLAVVAALVDNGIKSILWVDPLFNGGRLAQYSEVPSNTKARLFDAFCEKSKTLDSLHPPSRLAIQAMDRDKGCPLLYPAKLVQEFSSLLDESYGIIKYKGIAHDVSNVKGGFELKLTQDPLNLETPASQFDQATVDITVFSQNVHMATGSIPKTLPVTRSSISLEDALTPSVLKTLVSQSDRVLVIGNSHSGVLVLRNLYNLGIQTTCAFRSPILFAQHLDDRIQYDNTGLKGIAAHFARSTLPNCGIQMVQVASMADIDALLPHADHVICCTGLERRPLPIAIDDYDPLTLSLIHI